MRGRDAAFCCFLFRFCLTCFIFACKRSEYNTLTMTMQKIYDERSGFATVKDMTPDRKFMRSVPRVSMRSSKHAIFAVRIRTGRTVQRRGHNHKVAARHRIELIPAHIAAERASDQTHEQHIA